MVKEQSLSVLIAEADKVFSKYIRRRDADPNYPFFLRCFTCGKKERIEFAHAMHFIDRDQMAVRYDEMNVHGGCEECNCFDPDHLGKYYTKMVQKYGIIAVGDLVIKSKGLQKFMRHELVEIIETYKAKLKALT